MAGSAASGDGAGWRVFISHASELRDFPAGHSYVAAAERAISAAGHVIVNMADFAVTDQPPAQVCADRVRGCDVYVGLLGTLNPVRVPRHGPGSRFVALKTREAFDAAKNALRDLVEARLGAPAALAAASAISRR